MSEVKRKPRAAIYVRTSSDDGKFNLDESGNKPKKIGHKKSLELQVEACRDLCEREGYEVRQIAFDQNISGRTYPKGEGWEKSAEDDRDAERYFRKRIRRISKKFRPGLAEIMSNLDDIDVIVVRDIFRLSRPSRSSQLSNRIIQEFTEHGVKTIHTISHGRLDIDNYAHLMMMSLTLLMGDKAKEEESDASIIGLRNNINKGYLGGCVKCFGFQSSGHQEVAMIEDEIKIVKLIFRYYLKLLFYHEKRSNSDKRKKGMLMPITKWLNRKQIPSPAKLAADREREAKRKRGEKLKPDKKTYVWSVYDVRKVLQRPWYAGLQYNTDGILIESKVFPSGENAVISRDQYLRVYESFRDRRSKESSDVSNVDGTNQKNRFGEPRINGRIHPFSSLVKCGVCGRNLYMAKVTNKYGDKRRGKNQIITAKDSTPSSVTLVDTYYYMCKTPQYTKDEKYTDCRRNRIKEQYPQKSIEMGITPGGNGLIEALFPLMFHGIINDYIESSTTHPILRRDRNHLSDQMKNLERNESRYLEERESGILDDSQFANAMKRCHQIRVNLQSQLNILNEEIDTFTSGSFRIPEKAFQNPDKLSMETLQSLVHATFREIKVFPDRISVHLKNAESPFDIQRVISRNANNLPFWRARVNTPGLTKDTRIGVTFFYKSTYADNYANVEILYQDSRLEVMAIGNNNSIDKKRSPQPEPNRIFNEAMKRWFGPPPKYGRELVLDSNVFLSKLIAK